MMEVNKPYVCLVPDITPLRLSRASATLDQMRLSARRCWQVAFLGEAEPRAARPEEMPDE